MKKEEQTNIGRKGESKEREREKEERENEREREGKEERERKRERVGEREAEVRQGENPPTESFELHHTHTTSLDTHRTFMMEAIQGRTRSLTVFQ